MAMPFGIERSTLAGGLTGVATLLIGYGLSLAGISLPPDTIASLVAVLVPLVVHFVPDAAKIDQTIKDAAGSLPQTYEKYPATASPLVSEGQANSNINKS